MTSQKTRDSALAALHSIADGLERSDVVRPQTAAVMHELIDVLKNESESCKFNCRDKSEAAWTAAWMERAADEGGGKWVNPTEEERARECYLVWKKNQ